MDIGIRIYSAKENVVLPRLAGSSMGPDSLFVICDPVLTLVERSERNEMTLKRA